MDDSILVHPRKDSDDLDPNMEEGFCLLKRQVVDGQPVLKEQCRSCRYRQPGEAVLNINGKRKRFIWPACPDSTIPEAYP